MAFGFKLAEALVELRLVDDNNFSRQLGTTERRLRAIGSIVTAAGAAGVTAFTGFAAVAARAAAKAETSFAAVRKTTGASGGEFEILKQQINDLGVNLAGISNQELRGIAAVAGQLGVSTKDIGAFTESIAKAVVALDVAPDTAANSMSELNTQFKFGLQNVDKVTSAINELSNTTRASASDILEITRRLSGTGGTLGLSIPQVTALATSLKEAGITSEVAGTSISKLLGMIADPGEWEKFAAVIGKTKEAFGDLATNNPFEALRQVVELLNRSKGPEAFAILEEIGMSDIRGRSAILQLARAFDTLERNLNTANQAFEEGTSIEREYGIFADTAAGQLQRLSNSAEQAAEGFGQHLLPGIRMITEELQKIAEGLKDGGTFWADYAASATWDIEQVIGAVKSLGEAIADVHAGDGTPSALSGGLAGQALKNLQHTTTPDEAKRQYDIAIQETQNQLASARAKKPLELANFSGLGGGPGGLEPPANNNEIERLEAKLKELKEARDKVAGNEVMMGKLIGSAFDAAGGMIDKGMEFGKAAGAALGEAFGPQIEKIKERLKIDDIKAGRGGGGGLMDQLKAIDPLTMKWLAGDGKGDGVDAQRGGAITNGAAQIWDKIVSDTFDKNAMRKAERQRDQQIKELIDIRKEHGVKLDQLIENTKGGKVAIAG